MSRTRKEKLEIYTDASLQLLPEESAATVANNCIETTLEKRKKEANKPLYLRRI
jgi:hypothetical protein